MVIQRFESKILHNPIGQIFGRVKQIWNLSFSFPRPVALFTET